MIVYFVKALSIPDLLNSCCTHRNHTHNPSHFVGLSNFNIRKIQYILDHARIRPAALQVELHPGLHQNELLEFCKKNNIHVTAYSPLGNNVYGQDRIVDDAAVSYQLVEL